MSLKANRIKTSMGITLYLDKNDSLGLSFNKSYETLETSFIKDSVKKSMTIILQASLGVI